MDTTTRVRPFARKSLLTMMLATLLVVLIPAGAAVAAGNTVASAWKDSKGRNVVLYQGTYNTSTKAGFGWAKIKGKHAITKYNTVKFPTLNPDGGTAQGTQRLYKAWAQKWQVINGRWTITAEVEVRTVVETATKSLYYNVRLNASPGVLTTYCVNANKADACPWWVDTAFANGNRPPGSAAARSSQSTATSTGYTAGYGSTITQPASDMIIDE
ncbi:hypothetical protein [Microbacterium sp. SSM24]|uniref:hypothetical protein n=1 Tax=Microbacterium sp. SSM24 TaxID=2991714 RepID=UPI002226EB11|nr:hypothetical protein [Microbacterium sp. SSM24]MCW3492881.1 hypothetical protein [Microbacterium sp. SSM24]